ncbi:MAG: hypothetical protein INR68_11280 [Methylobacterium mesophilicum]|nr:hypothetical protein [Methylobacterium mesophilicum]
MTASANHTPREVIARHLERHSRTLWPISVCDAVRAVRQAVPDSIIDDRDLADMVAIAAIEQGLSVSFDRDLLSA